MGNVARQASIGGVYDTIRSARVGMDMKSYNVNTRPTFLLMHVIPFVLYVHHYVYAGVATSANSHAVQSSSGCHAPPRHGGPAAIPMPRGHKTFRESILLTFAYRIEGTS